MTKEGIHIHHHIDIIPVSHPHLIHHSVSIFAQAPAKHKLLPLRVSSLLWLLGAEHIEEVWRVTIVGVLYNMVGWEGTS